MCGSLWIHESFKRMMAGLIDGETKVRVCQFAFSIHREPENYKTILFMISEFIGLIRLFDKRLYGIRIFS